jgi:rubrerythrin
LLSPGKESAVKSLLAAYQGETTAHAIYKAFAVKADADGLPGAASLFRAIARAEQIHASNHARVIRQMGGEAIAKVSDVHVKATLVNLKTALLGEQHEIDVLYPAFLKESTSYFDAAAVRTLNWALQAEKTHARLYTMAIAQLEENQALTWTGAAKSFYICPVCGYTASTREAENCPVCNYIWERFEILS